MFVLARAITYATLFVALVLIYIPSRVLSMSGIMPPPIGAWQMIGMIIGTLGAGIALWCIFSFIFIGKGTPAPFDPPRKLVISGPYRYVRNPMYVGAGMALIGAALFYESLQLLSYIVILFLITHLLIVLYEEPTLRKTFGREYEDYCNRVRRWWPRIPSA